MDKEVEKFYVYVHRYASGDNKGKVFYVGKGSGRRRYKSRSGRNKHWERVVSKYGFNYSVVKNFKNEQCALTYEKILIDIIGLDKLVNKSVGGQGVSGCKHTESYKHMMSKRNKGISPSKTTIIAAIKKNSKQVGTKCGMRFDSISDAARFILGDDYKSAKTSISSCVVGRNRFSYGYEWGEIIDGELKFNYQKKKSDHRPWKYKPVGTMCGLSFKSLNHATKWLKEKGLIKASSPAIVRSCKNKTSTAYGYKWKYIDEDKTKMVSAGSP